MQILDNADKIIFDHRMELTRINDTCGGGFSSRWGFEQMGTWEFYFKSITFFYEVPFGS